MVAAVLVLGFGCQKLFVVSISVSNVDVETIETVKVHVQQTGGSYVYDGIKPVNEQFRQDGRIGVYLPTGVRRFSVTIDAFGGACHLFEGSRPFDLDDPNDVLLVVALTTPVDSGCMAMNDGGDSGDGEAGMEAGQDTCDALADRDDLLDTGTETPHNPTDCGAEAPTSTCFDPADPDAGTADPFAENATNPECNDYCAAATSACPAIFADEPGCMTVCTEAGWHLPADADGGVTPLSCLTDRAQTATTVPMPVVTSQCGLADPGGDECAPACETYCTLREALCGDRLPASPDCLQSCYAQERTRLMFAKCLFQVLEHDVPRDRRFCAWVDLAGTCGRCSSL
jgi:hypothetical protein